MNTQTPDLSALRDDFAKFALLAQCITDMVPGEANDALMAAAAEANQEPLTRLAMNSYEIAEAMLLARMQPSAIASVTALAAAAGQAEAQKPTDLVAVPRDLLGAASAAIAGQHAAPETLKQLRRYTVGDLSTRPAPRFADVPCSHCAQSFGPGTAGFSHCEDHKHLTGRPA